MAEKGSISIHAQNIMPVIKRWLYSDKDIYSSGIGEQRVRRHCQI